MRNIVIRFWAILMILTGCSAHQKEYRIGVSQCLDDAWRQKMNAEMERELLLHPEMTLSRRIAYGSNERQCAQIDSFIAERVDLLIVSPNVAEEVKPAVTRAYRAGIPVIVADRRVSGEEWTAFIGGDNYQVGRLMADWILSVQAEQKKALQVLEVAGLPGSTPATLRHQGMLERLAEVDGVQPKIESVMGAWYKEEAYQVVRDYLGTHAHVDVIVAHNDLMAIGAAEAVRDSTSRGDMIIETASRILAKQPFVRDTVLETMLIDANIASPMLVQIQARLHDLETLHIVQLQSESRWQQIQYGRTMLIASLVLVGVFFFLALGFLIYSQRKINKEIKRDILPQLEEVQEAIQLNHKDVAFGERLQQIVEDHLSDPNLNVEFLGAQLALSRTQIFRRVKTITGKGPLDYIRERRLIRADELLRTTDMTIQQVAFELCFSSPGYFTKCYKEQFGHLPSQR